MSNIYESSHLMSPANEKKSKRNLDSPLKASNDFNENSSLNCQQNKLPLNLFLTPAEYNKMLITNGKNRAKQTSYISEGYLSNLQFVNDGIFEKMEEKRGIARLSIKHESKTQKKSYDQCTCCCCQQFCQQCSIKGQNCNKFQSIEMRKAMSEIDNEISLARERKKIPLSGSKQRSNQKNHIGHSRRVNSALSASNRVKCSFMKISQLSHPVIQNTPDISHLIMKSLIEFEATKKKEAFLKKEAILKQKAKQEYLKKLDAYIRSNNLKQSKSQRSISKVKSKSKTKISRNYWEKVKDEVAINLKSDNYSGILKQQLKNYKLNVYNHEELPKKQVTLSKSQIEKLRRKHEEEAKKQIELEMTKKLQKKQKIQANLDNLQKQRLHHIKAAPHKPFKPTEEMINSAFKNTVQPQKNVNQHNIKPARKSHKRVTINEGTNKY